MWLVCTSKFRLVILCLLANPISGVIYELTESEYTQMPAVIYLDDYEKCLEEHHGLYCTIQFSSVSDEPSKLLMMMQEYSKQNKTHYDHTKFQYGICVTQKCKKLLQHNTGVLEQVLEECLNQTFWNEHKLRTQVYRYSCKKTNDGNIPINASDMFLGFIILSLITLSTIGSIYDLLFIDNNWNVKEYLLSFSIKRNWKKLFLPSNSTDNRHMFRAINGFKSLSLLTVMWGHCTWLYVNTAKNIKDIEDSYNYLSSYIYLNGSINIQVSFFTSGFLVMYNVLKYSERNVITLQLYPRRLIYRIFRIIPSYALVLGLVGTWFRRAGSGPLWEIISMKPSNDCRRNWWIHLLFLNNYAHNSTCLGHTWYIAADMQLYVMGLLVCILVSIHSSKRKILIILYGVCLIIRPAIVYFRDLYPTFLISPETTRVFFVEDRTYNELYIRSYTNCAPFVLGMLVADLLYSEQFQKTLLDKIKKDWIYCFFYWSLPPLMILLLISGMYFYTNASLDTLLVRVVYAILVPTVYTVIWALLFVGFILKFENLYRLFIEWDGWRIPSRLSYSAYLLHFPVIHYITGTKTGLTYWNDVNMFTTFIEVTAPTFSLAILLWLLVEAPFSQMNKLYFTSKTNYPTPRRIHSKQS